MNFSNTYKYHDRAKVSYKHFSLLQILEDGLVTISLTPDEQGRFGFNVKGGLDLDMPILVSRVAPNTPADRCFPKLNEGDQVRIH